MISGQGYAQVQDSRARGARDVGQNTVEVAHKGEKNWADRRPCGKLG